MDVKLFDVRLLAFLEMLEELCSPEGFCVQFRERSGVVLKSLAQGGRKYKRGHTPVPGAWPRKP